MATRVTSKERFLSSTQAKGNVDTNQLKDIKHKLVVLADLAQHFQFQQAQFAVESGIRYPLVGD